MFLLRAAISGLCLQNYPGAPVELGNTPAFRTGHSAMYKTWNEEVFSKP